MENYGWQIWPFPAEWPWVDKMKEVLNYFTACLGIDAFINTIFRFIDEVKNNRTAHRCL